MTESRYDMKDLKNTLNETRKDIFEDEKSTNPFDQFHSWISQAIEDGAGEPNAGTLSTANAAGQPSARTLLLKKYDEENGFLFFTDRDSRKAQDLQENPQASLHFYWSAPKRQVKIEGTVTELDEAEALVYWHKRPRSAKISSYVSQQSSTVDPVELKRKIAEAHKKFEGSDIIPCPKSFVGYLIHPTSYEFWEGRTIRLHNCVRFRKLSPGEKPIEGITHVGVNDWVYEYIAP